MVISQSRLRWLDLTSLRVCQHIRTYLNAFGWVRYYIGGGDTGAFYTGGRARTPVKNEKAGRERRLRYA
jgi:hypothetical protein